MRWSPTRNALAMMVSAGLTLRRGQGGRREVDAEAAAPDSNGAILVQIQVRRQIVILITHVSLEIADAYETCFGDSLVVFGVGGGDKINLDVRTI
jgi:hypothetical protein